jgi:hypothetical protein
MSKSLFNFVRTNSSSNKVPQVHAVEKEQQRLDGGKGIKAMDLFHHHNDGDKKEKRRSLVGGINRSSSPKVATVQQLAKLEIGMESPPLVFYGTPAHSTGALLSGQLILTVKADGPLTLSTLDMELVAKVTTKKPVSKDCPECASKTSEVFTWKFITTPTTYKPGVHPFPFSYLLPGHLPATSHGHLFTVDYILCASALPQSSSPITIQHTLLLKRALVPPPNARSSLRVFPPTTLSATLALPPLIHPIGTFPVTMRITGVIDKLSKTAHPSFERRWRLRNLNWRIEELSRCISAACAKHTQKLGGEGKGVLHMDTRVVGEQLLKDGWKTDFSPSTADGVVEIEFPCSITPSSHVTALCDLEHLPLGLAITHQLVVELVVAEEIATSPGAKNATPTGIARVLRMVFGLVVTERMGLGVSWDEEMPPVYEDVPGSPPRYAEGTVEELPMDGPALDHMR